MENIENTNMYFKLNKQFFSEDKNHRQIFSKEE